MIWKTPVKVKRPGPLSFYNVVDGNGATISRGLFENEAQALARIINGHEGLIKVLVDTREILRDGHLDADARRIARAHIQAALAAVESSEPDPVIRSAHIETEA